MFSIQDVILWDDCIQVVLKFPGLKIQWLKSSEGPAWLLAVRLWAIAVHYHRMQRLRFPSSYQLAQKSRENTKPKYRAKIYTTTIKALENKSLTNTSEGWNSLGVTLQRKYYIMTLQRKYLLYLVVYCIQILETLVKQCKYRNWFIYYKA